MRQGIVLLAGALTLALAGPAAASSEQAAGDAPATRSVPSTIAYQGYLTDGGTPVDGTFDLDLALYNVSVGGTAIWSETQTGIAINQGVFEVSLGAVTSLTLSLFDGSPLWLGVAVNGQPELPRTKLETSPFAFRAAVADSALNGGGGDDGDWTVAGSDLYSSVSGDVGIGTSSPATKLHVEGDIRTGSSAIDGGVLVYGGDGITSFTTFLGNTTGVGSNVIGGRVDVYDEAGRFATTLQPDESAGGGGRFEVRADSLGSRAFEVNGNWGTSTEPRVLIGSTGQIAFLLDQADDATVQLPANAINSTEQLDEPGAASDADGSFSVTLTGSGTVDVVRSQTITAPADGYVLAIGTGQIRVTHSNGTPSSIDFGVSASSTALPVNQDVNLTIPSTSASATYEVPVTVHGLFSVSAGANTLYLLGRETNGGGLSDLVWDTQLTLVYLPTAYGTVDPTLTASGPQEEVGPGAPPLSPADVESNRLESMRANQDRIQREMDAMQTRMAELERELVAERGEVGIR